MPEGYHPPLEEYLEAVHDLEEEGTPVIQARLAQRVGHSAPTVSEMVRRLRDEGYFDIQGRSILFTDKGRAAAESVVRKHRLAEVLLTTVIGLEWHKCHLEATRWEHVISDEVEDLIQNLLGRPSVCPHGNPVPGNCHDDAPLRRLSEATAGETVRLARVTEQAQFDFAALVHLDTNDFRPAVEASVVANTGGAVQLTVAGKPLDIDPELAGLLFVTG